jgi:hypothetical protein
MATIKNEIDKILQAASPRIIPVSLPQNVVINVSNLSTTTGDPPPIFVDGPPTNNPVPTGISISENNNGTRDITLTWTYTQGTIRAEGIGIAYRGDHSTVLVTDPNVTFGPETTSALFRAVDARGTYRAGIAAYRFANGAYQIGPVIQPISAPDWRVSPPGVNDFEVIIANDAIKQSADVSVGTGTHNCDFELSASKKITATGDFTLAFVNVPNGYLSRFTIYAVNWGTYTITLPTHTSVGGITIAFTAIGMDRLIAEFDKDGNLTLYIEKDIK